MQRYAEHLRDEAERYDARGYGPQADSLRLTADQLDATTCLEATACPDDLIRPCVKPKDHDGWHWGGVR